MQHSIHMTQKCNFCNNFAYTTYRDKLWVEYKLCVKHISIFKEKNKQKVGYYENL